MLVISLSLVLMYFGIGFGSARLMAPMWWNRYSGYNYDDRRASVTGLFVLTFFFWIILLPVLGLIKAFSSAVEHSDPNYPKVKAEKVRAEIAAAEKKAEDALRDNLWDLKKAEYAAGVLVPKRGEYVYSYDRAAREWTVEDSRYAFHYEDKPNQRSLR